MSDRILSTSSLLRLYYKARLDFICFLIYKRRIYRYLSLKLLGPLLTRSIEYLLTYLINS